MNGEVAALIDSVRDRPAITRMSHRSQIEKIEQLRDALRAAGVVAEEPEWEYECRVDSAWDWRYCTEDSATCPRGSERRRRRKSGPWEPTS